MQWIWWMKGIRQVVFWALGRIFQGFWESIWGINEVVVDKVEEVEEEAVEGGGGVLQRVQEGEDGVHVVRVGVLENEL